MTYSHIIVGAGSSGATLAGRLSANTENHILLLEAGPDYRTHEAPEAMFSPNPGRIITAPEFEKFRYPDLDAARTGHQKQMLYWRGRGAGGSSAINGQIAIRGVPEDYDIWTEEGCEGWSYSDVLPYFNRLENDLRYGDEAYHGAAGPIPIYRAPLNDWGPVDRSLGEASLNLGYPWAPDHNAPGAAGVSPYAINSLHGRRVSTNDAYLEPNRGRTNLEIRGDCGVDKIVFEGTTAVGVQLISGEMLRADKIVLSAGAVHSPTILMRSGIGPEDHLKSLGIDLRVVLPVGQNFQDHPVVALIVNLKDAYTPEEDFRHTNCCIRYSSGLEGAGTSDMMIVSMNRLGDSIGRHMARGQRSAANFGTLSVWVNECYSRGSVRLQSVDPTIEPVINENMLDDPRDRARLRDGVARLLELAAQPAFAAISESIVRSGDAAPLSTLRDARDVDDWTLRYAGDTQHGSCSCRMGREDDPRTVVDSQCRVLGMQNLWVVDASVMPNVPRANTHLTAVMIAEKMAEKL